MRPKIAALFITIAFSASCLAESGLTLSGRYEYRTDATSLEMRGDLVCFYPSSKFAKSLPRPKSDMRAAWFCFTNKARSKALLKIPNEKEIAGCGLTGQATVHVTKYTTYLGEGDGFDTAQLQSANNVSKAKVLPCE